MLALSEETKATLPKKILHLKGQQVSTMAVKAIRIWILGASIAAFIFLTISTDYHFWAMKTLINTRSNHENTTYFGLWKKCFDYRAANINGTKQVMTSYCVKYSDGDGLLGITETPAFIKTTRGFLIFYIVIMGISSIVTGVLMVKCTKPLIYSSGVMSLIGVIAGVIIMAVFVGSINRKDLFKDYSPAWAFYYFVIGWLFTISVFFAALTDYKTTDGEKA